MKTLPTIKTSTGEGTIEQLWISELGYLMLKVYHEKESRWITYNLGTYDPTDNVFTKILNDAKIKI